MNIIFVSDKLSGGKNFSLSNNQTLLLLGSWLVLPFLIFLALTQSSLSGTEGANASRPQRGAYLQENLNAMAARLGKLQAQVLRMDALGGRLAKHFGLPEQEFNFSESPGQGGAEPSSAQHLLNPQQLEHELIRFEQLLEARSDSMGMLEVLTLRERVEKSVFPSLYPVSSEWFSSNFGWRLDPFSGKQSMHEGVDFTTGTGTPIKAAAGGKVATSEYHPQYGNMVAIDHGNGLTTRYAHASKILVKVGDIVLQGQKIAEVGSTGRSTGSHLHFEVLNNGVPQNPAKYLSAIGNAQG
ncbi:MAG: M23 family metallopeptidase [Sulfuricellaceae bacterium]|nr:M23 family metallopeptidase [Sulfuricellaceae bacterium]